MPRIRARGDAIDRAVGIGAASLKASSEAGGLGRARANDGNDATEWSEVSGVGVPDAWWAIDLGAGRVVYYWRLRQQSANNDRPEGGSLYVTDDAAAWAALVNGSGKMAAPGAPWSLVDAYAGLAWPIETGNRLLDPPAAGRYWLFHADAGPAPGGTNDCDVSSIELRDRAALVGWPRFSLGLGGPG